MREKGVGGFFLCPRQGLTVPYLSEVWFDKVRVALDEARENGMDVWLYDEYPYPSGIAGGEVTLLHPEAKHQTLEHRSMRASGGETLRMELPWARVISARAVPLDSSGRKLWEAAVEIRSFIGNHQADPVFQKTGLTAYNQKRFFTYRTVFRLQWAVPPGEWEVHVFLEREIDDFKYYGTFVDPCNKEAMATFIRLTHERYKSEVGEYFGTVIKGMFTDEIGLLGNVPWSPQVAEFFEARCGYALTDVLPALVDEAAPNAAKHRYDYFQTVHLLLRESYHKQVHDWCEANGLQYVAEVPAMRMTTQLFSHVVGGDSAHEKLGRSLEWVLDRYAGRMRDNPKMVSSLARQLGRERNLIECFHSVGWSMTLQDARWMIDRMAALGTNFYNFHAFYYTMDAMAKHDAPPSQFFQNPYWSHFRALADYTSRISYVMSEGRAHIRMAIVDPATSLWTHLGNPLHGYGYCGVTEAEEARLERLKQDWSALAKRLLQERMDYDHLDSELLAEADISGGTVKLGQAEYELLILPPMTNLEAKAWAKLQQFMQEGGTVISFGLLPYEPIEPGSPAEAELLQVFGAARQEQLDYWREAEAALALKEAYGRRGRQAGATAAQAGGAGASSAAVATASAPLLRQGSPAGAYFIARDGAAHVDTALDELVRLLNELAPAAVRLETASRSFLMQTRWLAENKAAVFISNQEGGSHDVLIRIDPRLLGAQAAGKHGEEKRIESIRRLDLETGLARPLAARHHDGEWRLDLAFSGYESHCIEITLQDEAAPDESVRASDMRPVADWSKPHRFPVTPAGPWLLEAAEPNIIRFETFRLAMEQLSPEMFTVQAKTFIDQCADLKEQVTYPLRFDQIFGTPMNLSFRYPVSCTYAAAFTVDALPQKCQLMMDRSAVSGVWLMYVNGQVISRDDFRQEMVYDPANLACDITKLLQTGCNELRIEVEVQHDWDGVTDPIYLRGDFGVAFDADRRPVMTEPPSAAGTVTMEPCEGYPYYAGQLTYRKALLLEQLPESDVFELDLSEWPLHDCIEVAVNGHSLGVRPWSPYRWEGASALLRPGSNDVEVRVTNTLIGLIEGKYFDYQAHTVIPVEHAEGRLKPGQ
ncbi:glycosyl hydrolase [Paenibacillus sp. y28]